MSSGTRFADEVVSRCIRAMREGVPLAHISDVEGVALPTLYVWRRKQLMSEPRPTMESLMQELHALRTEVRVLRARLGE